MGSEKVQNYADDIIYGWSLTIFIFRRKQSGEGNISSPPIRMTNIITGAILRSIWSQTVPTIDSRICVNHNIATVSFFIGSNQSQICIFGGKSRQSKFSLVFGQSKPKKNIPKSMYVMTYDYIVGLE